MALTILPPSNPPKLKGGDESGKRIIAMQNWFLENFDVPADDLPYESAERDHKWIWGGPFYAREEISAAFPDAEESEIEEAVDTLESVTFEWTVGSNRIVDDKFDADEPRIRQPAHADNKQAWTVVETTLLPLANFGWVLKASFIPGHTNLDLGEELDSFKSDLYGYENFKFRSLRHLVQVLIEQDLEGEFADQKKSISSSYDWIKNLERDDKIFVDDSIIVHGSPPSWLSLRHVFQVGEASGVSGIMLLSGTPGHATGVLLAWGGARIFFQLISGLSAVQAAFFERLSQRIRDGDFDEGASPHREIPPPPKKRARKKHS